MWLKPIYPNVNLPVNKLFSCECFWAAC